MCEETVRGNERDSEREGEREEIECGREGDRWGDSEEWNEMEEREGGGRRREQRGGRGKQRRGM